MTGAAQATSSPDLRSSWASPLLGLSITSPRKWSSTHSRIPGLLAVCCVPFPVSVQGPVVPSLHQGLHFSFLSYNPFNKLLLLYFRREIVNRRKKPKPWQCVMYRAVQHTWKWFCLWSWLVNEIKTFSSLSKVPLLASLMQTNCRQTSWNLNGVINIFF